MSTEMAIKDFIVQEFLESEDAGELDSDTELVTSGILDSLATLKLITFLENEFQIQIEPHEVDDEHLNTIKLICDLVASKRSG